VIGQERSHKPSFSGRCRDVPVLSFAEGAANAGAVDHVLPVIGQTQIDQRLQQGIPHALFGPAPEPNIGRVPYAISLMHIAPGAACAQPMQHSIREAPIIARWPGMAATLRRQQRPDQFPLRIRQISTTHDCSSRNSLESEAESFGNPIVNTA